MYDINDMKNCIQLWFADAITCPEVAKTYAEILIETEKQMELMMEERVKTDSVD